MTLPAWANSDNEEVMGQFERWFMVHSPTSCFFVAVADSVSTDYV